MESTAFNLYNINGIGNNMDFAPVSNPFTASTNSVMPDFFNSFGGTNFSPVFNGDFMSTFNMFNAYLCNQMPLAWQNQFFTSKFNTTSNLPQLKNVYNPSLGNKLANIANRNASEMNSRHSCLKGVRTALNQMSLVNGKMGGSAYQAAQILSNHKNFKEVQVDTKDLKNLPAGCVIVWDRNYVGTKTSDIHGHIAVTLGDGREASDHVANKTYILNSNHRVFVPVGMDKTA